MVCPRGVLYLAQCCIFVGRCIVCMIAAMVLPAGKAGCDCGLVMSMYRCYAGHQTSATMRKDRRVQACWWWSALGKHFQDSRLCMPRWDSLNHKHHLCSYTSQCCHLCAST